MKLRTMLIVLVLGMAAVAGAAFAAAVAGKWTAEFDTQIGV